MDVVEGVARASKNVDKALQPTDDLAEVRRSGRPWKPLMFEHLPEGMQSDFKRLYDDVGAYMHEKGVEWRKVEDGLKKKYGKDIPREELEKHARLFNQYLIGEANGVKFAKDAGLLDRIEKFDVGYRKHIRDSFERERQKASDVEKFDRAFSKFKKQIDDADTLIYGEFNFAQRFLVGDYVNSVVGMSWNDGYSGKPFISDKFSVADREAKKLMDNPDKRVVVFVDAGMLGGILDNGGMKNFFEAKSNVFNAFYDEMAKYDKWGANERRKSYLAGRLRGEQAFAGLPVNGVPAGKRPIYGLVMPDGLRAQTNTDFAYGDVGVVMRHSVEGRSTFTAEDSLNSKFQGASPINNPSGISMLGAIGGLATADKRRASTSGNNDDYIEAQIMGGVKVGDISYLTVKDDSVLSTEIRARLKEMGIPVVVHSSNDVYEEPAELASKAASKSGGYVLLATYGDRKLFVPDSKPAPDDFHGMLSVGNGKRKRVENVNAVMKFGNWEFV